MLGKLIKHDFRALSRTLFPLQIGILAGGIVAALFMTLNLRLSGALQHDGSMLYYAFAGTSGALMVIIAVCVAASAFVTLLLICIQFYRNLLGSEGYLTFTLPVTTGRVLWSKLIAGMLWQIINAVVICVAALIFAVFGTAQAGLMNPDVLATLRGLLAELSGLGRYANLPLVIAECLVFALLLLAATLLQAYFAIAVGGRASKHPLLASVGMYILLSIGVNMIRSFLTVVFAIGSLSFGVVDVLNGVPVTALFNSGLIWGCVASAAFSAAFFLGTHAVLKRRLNLQ
ncbi:MAG: hypothetical protein Q4C13_04265 [Clostridia bacterium]|nr:hypothetical protein [Clostridia bacterium]